MEIGIIGKQEIIVTEEKTAKAMGSGELNVFATPAMIALMENTAYTSVADQLESGQGTVGTLMNVKHLAATPVGMKVTCQTKLIEIDRRRLVFEVSASDEAGLIGEGIHERFIVDNAKFQSRADAKREAK
ncbi:MAG: thioesterase family protein [Eubacteriales bacterium]|nr:thioesterase family protein [Eubacteriales bacterium]